MRWKGREGSKNIEDHRGKTFKRGAGVGVGGIIMALVAIFFLNKIPCKLLAAS